MKLHYTKIILFSIPLNILVSSSYVHNKNKLYITPHHTPRYTPRVLSEGDIQSSNYDNDAEMKSVKENFHRQTSQRFEEYEERMKDKRQKRKEERDKNIQKIIEKDKMEKSLADKVEKGCLWCGCGLGGVAASVGIFGTVAVKELAKTATAAAAKEAGTAAMADATAKGVAAGKEVVIAGLEDIGVSTLNDKQLVSYFATTDYNSASLIFKAINSEYQPSQCAFTPSGTRQAFCNWVNEKSGTVLNVKRGVVSDTELVQTHVSELVAKATAHAGEVTKAATEDAIKISTDAVEYTYGTCQTAIIASVVALLIIVLVMIIIYLVLRYRRKKKMNKKAEYTKLLNQ
ncbi:PIR protein [Plasmodium reichenowi]|uniref:PIR protein n=1 Tax=Plasmodium reichenowi TaxID=5854 RepID=A0A2P9DT29_PLARE|nr:PIR protein [Plasmodium reichenowi]